jgi:hypothetical protein
MPDDLCGLLCRWSVPLLAAMAKKTLVMDHYQLPRGKAPDELPGHGGTEELLVRLPGLGELGLGPYATFIILLAPEADGLLGPCLLSPFALT